jgi:hypothetical protein
MKKVLKLFAIFLILAYLSILITTNSTQTYIKNDSDFANCLAISCPGDEPIKQEVNRQGFPFAIHDYVNDTRRVQTDDFRRRSESRLVTWFDQSRGLADDHAQLDYIEYPFGSIANGVMLTAVFFAIVGIRKKVTKR